jgi:hypothetical protein
VSYPTRLLHIVAALLLSALLAAPAVHAWEVDGEAPEEAFSLFHDRFATAAYFFPRHGAKPMGLLGFEVWVDTSADPGFGDEELADQVIDGDLTGDVMAIGRVGVRKGLPGGFDIGAAYGQTLGGDVKLVSGELSYALIEGSAVVPAVGIRLTGTQTLDSRSYDLEQYGVEVIVSKGLTIATPYAGAGLVRSESELERVDGSTIGESSTDGVFFAGVRLKLLVPSLTFEVEQGEHLQGAVRIGFGL